MAPRMGRPKIRKMKNPKQRMGPRLATIELINPPKSKAGGVTIAVAGTYVFGKDAPNVYCLEAEAFGFDHVYVIRPSLSRPVCGSEGKPEGAACQRGSSGLTPGGRWKMTVKSVSPTTY